MTPPTNARMAAWAFAILCLVLLWTIGYAGPTVCTILLGLCAAATIFLLGWGLIGLRNAAKNVAIANISIAMGAAAIIGVFVYQVLSSEDESIVVSSSGPPVYLMDGSSIHVNRIRLFDLNVLHGYPDFDKQHERFKDAVKDMERLNADILILQETWTVAPLGNMADRLSKELGRNFVYGRANGRYSHIGFEEGGAILSRFSILEAKRMCMQPRSPWWENRVALMAKLDIGWGRPLIVVGVHLSNSESADDQAEFLLNLLRESPPDILAGDFNSLPDSRAVKAVLAAGFVEALPGNKSAEPWIDHVFFSPRLLRHYAVSEASWVIATQPVAGVRDAISDHDGILVELTKRAR
jgi:endonuclease/exonuclease/phosphatase family metal-dependent hydrolase